MNLIVCHGERSAAIAMTNGYLTATTKTYFAL
jgi:hypothetical protein